jgi:hypothetical protein
MGTREASTAFPPRADERRRPYGTGTKTSGAVGSGEGASWCGVFPAGHWAFSRSRWLSSRSLWNSSMACSREFSTSVSVILLPRA